MSPYVPLCRGGGGGGGHNGEARRLSASRGRAGAAALPPRPAVDGDAACPPAAPAGAPAAPFQWPGPAAPPPLPLPLCASAASPSCSRQGAAGARQRGQGGRRGGQRGSWALASGGGGRQTKQAVEGRLPEKTASLPLLPLLRLLPPPPSPLLLLLAAAAAAAAAPAAAPAATALVPGWHGHQLGPHFELQAAHAHQVLRDLGQPLLVLVQQELGPVGQVLVHLLQRLHEREHKRHATRWQAVDREGGC